VTPLLLRPIGKDDYAVIEADEAIGRIRLASERRGEVWMWNVTANIPGGVPAGTSDSLDQAKADFRAAWSAFQAASERRR
jgi:hypothetical protein